MKNRNTHTFKTKRLIGYFLLAIIVFFALNYYFRPSQPATPLEAEKVLLEKVVPNITAENIFVSDAVAASYSVDKIPELLPKIESFPLYGAQPNNDPKNLYIEIYSSAEKANAQKQDERWLVDVAEAFNAKQATISSGQTIQVGVRSVPSGLGTQLIAAKAAKPTGYTPTTDLWLEILKSEGVNLTAIAPALVPNHALLAIRNDVYDQLSAGGEVTFDRVIDRILDGKLTFGYANPYASSGALNLLYTLFWRAAGHNQDRKPLTVADVQSPNVSSVFENLQKQISLTTLTYLDLKQIFIRDPQKIQVFFMEYQSYNTLRRLPGFEKTAYVPFGVPHNSPLVGFDWNTSAQTEALKKFAEFATSTPMQQLAKEQGFEATDYLKQGKFPSSPSGEVLKAAQGLWKKRKDGGHTVSLMLVIDTSGSMAGDRIKAVKDGLRLASKQINAGNKVGLVTFSDRVRYLVPLAPFDKLQHQRLLAAIDSLQADGNTAMYDGTMVGLAELVKERQKDPNGRFNLLLLTDGEVTTGLRFDRVKEIMAQVGIRVYPISYGEANQKELEEIAKLRESTVKAGNPQNVQSLLKELFQVNL
jgi:Ca-activated chloride channel family protein